jgi:hypothetical protein
MTLAATSLGISGSASAVLSTTAFPVTTSNIHRFVGIHTMVSHTFTQSELTAIGGQNDIVVALPIQVNKYGAALRAVNPNIRFFVYQNGMFAQSDQGSAFPNSWYLKSATGAKIQSKSNKNYLMNPFSTAVSGPDAGWAAYVADRCASKLAQAPLASGCYLDQMSSAGNTDFVTSLPVNPQTGKLFTMPAYMAAVNLVGNAAAAKAPIIGNSYESGFRYYNNLDNTVDQSAMGLFEAEHWMGAVQPRDSQTLSKWKMDVQMLIDSQADGHGVLANFEDMSTNLDQWQAYTVASMLLGDNGHVWINFESSGSSGPQAWQLDTPLMNAPLGSPTQTYATVDGYLSGGVYQRDFTNGRVLVNPTSASVTVDLGQMMTTPTGTQVSTVTMAPFSGAVLLG